jgi:hypothetical protein
MGCELRFQRSDCVYNFLQLRIRLSRLQSVILSPEAFTMIAESVCKDHRLTNNPFAAAGDGRIQ